ncbi:double-strand break repair helicase AddA [Ascidiaceihabitans sp.]|uniref:double-strand break repair helicase AddA n=1 Tax=Ascidiaceihabitans sp. TaxID=1872644 RepID=UPI003297AA09
MMARDDATQRQLDAAAPTTSTWLAANAGSGKTRVLTDRVARLLLEGVQPQHILCLTYTKAAASEMQNRLFRRLGDWAMLPDAALRKALDELGANSNANETALRDARTLFARAIESPGGLKIQTIHSFCASLLRRFPLEADVSPQFTEIEDRAADMLRAEIVDDMAGGRDAHLVRDIARYYTGEDFLRLSQEIVRNRSAFDEPITRGDLLALMGQSPTLDASSLTAQTFLGSEQQLIADLVPLLQASSSKTDGTAAQKLQSIVQWDIGDLPLLESVFLTGATAADPFTAKIGKFPTKAIQATAAHLMPAAEDLMMRVESARDMRLSLLAVDRAEALHAFAKAFITRYEHAKLLRGWLDFDDLILKARGLLNDEKVAAWVLFRIDGGIDHILVDEAQDTSPDQWDVIRKLAEEFSSGEGARTDVARTLFVVGDKKQSIYSFQGADPREFDRMQAEFKQKFRDASAPFQETTLDYSFRSSSAILRLVDQTFDQRLQAGFDKDSQHIAFKDALPGRVDLWPVVETIKEADDREWFDPVDRRAQTHHSVLLADQIAHQIKTMIESDQTIPDDGNTSGRFVRRRIKAGDFLILVRRRSALFAEIIRACKAYDLPIAGADRLKVGAELAVRDLGALLSFLATQDDSLALATALRSPLFGWTEQELFTLAHGRTSKPLWQRLRERAADHPKTVSILEDLRNNADFLRPYDLIERILTRHAGRGLLLSRLGVEAEDGINALLSQALAFERNAIPSLTGFLVWMKTDDLDIKRQIDSASDQIRVMTVHGAKGLEAPIVILPDTAKRTETVRDEIIKIQGTPVWKASEKDAPAAMRAALEGIKDAQRNEQLRLLYVALTRAEKWLIVAAAGDLGKDGNSWYETVEGAMMHSGGGDVDVAGLGQIKRIEHGDWTQGALVSLPPKQSQTASLDPLFKYAAPPPIATAETLSPSGLVGPKALPGADSLPEDQAMAYGSLIHWHLENHEGDPPSDMHVLPDALIDQAKSEAEKVLNDPALRFVFDNTLAEVTVTAPVSAGRVHGAIDRLIVTDDTVTAIDFKSNGTVPATPQMCPSGILCQMWAYAAALAVIYPDRQIETAIVWTKTASYMSLPHDLVFQAAKSAGYLDESTLAS